jgi:hypothetical protein
MTNYKLWLKPKRTLLFLVIVILLSSIFLLLFYDRKALLKEIDTLKKTSDHLSTYREKELRIERMEKAVRVCFDMSAYEAHYYCIIYDDFSVKYDIPWEIYPAIIRIESNFDPTVMSAKSAKGIAQVLESTGKDVAEKIGIEYRPNSTLWNDLLCQIIGFTYLSEAIKKSGLDDGVKTYLGGPGFDSGRKDIGSYRTTVKKEYDRLTYIYKGVLYDSSTENSKCLSTGLLNSILKRLGYVD